MLSIVIDTQNKSMLIFIINNWNDHRTNISNEIDHHYIFNNSNQLNYINLLMEDAKYIVSIKYNKE